MLGDSLVGKTSIVNTFLNIEFTENNLMTIGTDKMESYMKMNDGNELKVIIWDTAGQERFHSIAKSTIKNAQGIIVSFDMTKRKTFENVNVWLNEIRENSVSIPIVLFGNKCDLKEKRTVKKEEAEKLAEANHLAYFETSAKLDINIKEGFKKICEDAYAKSGGELGMHLKKNKKKTKKNCCGKDN